MSETKKREAHYKNRTAEYFNNQWVLHVFFLIIQEEYRDFINMF